MKKLFLPLIALLFTASAVAQKKSTDGARIKKIDSLLTYLYDNNKFMGSVCLREKGEIIFQKAYGVADGQNRIPANIATTYKIGSITKMFTAAMIFQLIEEKKLTLETQLSEFYPDIDRARRITINDMLYHKSGIHDYTKDPAFAKYNTKPQTREAMLKRLFAYDSDFRPGDRSEYSNSNYLLLGYIIQDLTLKSYKDNLNERILTKAGLKNTYYFSKIDPTRNEAYSYKRKGTTWIKQPEWSEAVCGGAGGIQSTPDDLTLFIKALFDGKIISKTSLDQMTQLDNGYGRGILIYPFAERNFLGHNGGIEGFTSALGYYPKDDVAFALLLNASDYDSTEIVTGLLSILYRLPYRFPDLASFNADKKILKKYEGTYTSTEFPAPIEVKMIDGQLHMHAEEQGSFFLTPKSNTQFTHPSGIVIEFTDSNFTLKQNGTTTTFNKQ